MKNGRAHNILKATAHKRKRKEELAEERAEKDRQEKMKKYYAEMDETLRANHVSPGDIPQVVRQNQEMVHYLTGHGLIDERGQLKQ